MIKRAIAIVVALGLSVGPVFAQPPYTFGTQPGKVPASQLDADFSYLYGIVPQTGQANTWTGAQTFSGGMDGLVTAAGSTTARSLSARAAEVANVIDYGADPTGAANSTTAFNSALTSGKLAVYVPPGTYKVCGISMPSTANLVLYGSGKASILVASSGCASPVLGWNTGEMAWNAQTVRDLSFDGTNSADDIIQTAGQGTLTLTNLYENNLPNGFSFIYVNGTASTPTHDVCLENVQIYVGGSQVGTGYAGIHLGALAADSQVTHVIMQGGFATNYGVIADPGAVGVLLSGNHIYNLKFNALLLNGTGWFQSIGDTFDNAEGTVVSIQNAANTTFNGDYIEAVNSGQSGATVASSQGTNFTNTTFEASSGAVSAVVETGTSDYTIVIGGGISTLTAYSNVFNLTGAHSPSPLYVPGYSPLGLRNYTVATLPTCGASSQGRTAYVTDASGTPTWRGIPVGGGSGVYEVFCTGSGGWVYQ